MNVVGDLLARDRRSREVALVTDDGGERTYHDLITNAYKAANVLRYLGAREGATVAVPAETSLHATLAFLGGARLGACVRFDPDAGLAAGDRVVVVPVDRETESVPPPGTNLAAFGGPPERPETTYWEQELWSENPGTPPSSVGPDDPVVRAPGRDVEHAALLDAARSVVREHGIGPESRVVVRTTLSDPGAVAAGVVAPLLVGGTVVLVGPGADEATAARGEFAVIDGSGDVPGPQQIRPPAIPP